MIDRNLAKVKVGSSRLLSRSRILKEQPVLEVLRCSQSHACGGGADGSCSGLQSRGRRFDSDPRLHTYSLTVASMYFEPDSKFLSGRDGSSGVQCREKPPCPESVENDAVERRIRRRPHQLDRRRPVGLDVEPGERFHL